MNEKYIEEAPDEVDDAKLKAEYRVMAQTMERMRADFGRIHPEMATPKDFIQMREDFSYVIDFAQVIMANWVQTEIDLEDCTKFIDNLVRNTKAMLKLSQTENSKPKRKKRRRG